MNDARYIAIFSSLAFIQLATTQKHDEPAYRLVKKDGKFQLRDYEPFILAQVNAGPDFNGALYSGFMKLFNYISGKNTKRSKVRMTGPVTGEYAPAHEKIPMTAPVTSEKAAGGYVISFVMPAGQNLDTLPVPDDKSISFREIPAHRAAVVKFSGRMSAELAGTKARELDAWMAKNGLRPAGDRLMAQYDPPWIPGFLRRNEIIVGIQNMQ